MGRVLFCLVVISFIGCSSYNLQPELCRIESGNANNYIQTASIEEGVNSENIDELNNSRIFHHAIARPRITEYSIPVERTYRADGIARTTREVLYVNASSVWGSAFANTRGDAEGYAIENCENAVSTYILSQHRVFQRPPNVISRCRVTENSTCPASGQNEEGS